MKFLTEEQKKFYSESGYIILDILNENEIEEISKEYDDIFSRKAESNLEATWEGDWKSQNKKTVSFILDDRFTNCYVYCNCA